MDSELIIRERKEIRKFSFLRTFRILLGKVLHSENRLIYSVGGGRKFFLSCSSSRAGLTTQVINQQLFGPPNEGVERTGMPLLPL
jgi:hypothetical protein